MKTQEFFKKWKNDSPKSFKYFIFFLNKYFTKKNESFIISYFKIGCFKIKNIKRHSNLIIIDFEMLTGIIEKFFEENGIYISFYVQFKDAKHISYFYYDIDGLVDICQYRTKAENQFNGFLKAAEIMEKELGLNDKKQIQQIL